MSELSTKSIQTKITHRIDSETNWEQSILIPEPGELLVYQEHGDQEDNTKVTGTYIKFGDGKNTPSNLPYVNATFQTATALKLDELGESVSQLTISSSTPLEFEYIAAEDSYAVKKFNPRYNGTAVAIPSSYNDKPVTIIKEKAFKDAGLVAISLPDTIVTIEQDAFKNCASIRSLIIPNSVEFIGKGALSGCSSIESISLPFNGETRKDVTDSQQYPFGWIFGEDEYYNSYAAAQVFYAESGSEIESAEQFDELLNQGIITLTTYYIPNSLKHITLTDTCVLAGAFSYLVSIQDITLLIEHSKLSDAAFLGCSNLQHVFLPDSDDNKLDLGFGVFMECSNLLEVPGSVTSFKPYACAYCAMLREVTTYNSNLLSTTIDIPDYCFAGCVKLEKITEGNSLATLFGGATEVRSIGEGAFMMTHSLKTIDITECEYISPGAFQLSGLEDVYLSIKNNTNGYIGTQAFYLALYIKNLTLKTEASSTISTDAFSSIADDCKVTLTGDWTLSDRAIAIENGRLVANDRLTLETSDSIIASNSELYFTSIDNSINATDCLITIASSSKDLPKISGTSNKVYLDTKKGYSDPKFLPTESICEGELFIKPAFKGSLTAINLANVQHTYYFCSKELAESQNWPITSVNPITFNYVFDLNQISLLDESGKLDGKYQDESVQQLLLTDGTPGIIYDIQDGYATCISSGTASTAGYLRIASQINTITVEALGDGTTSINSKHLICSDTIETINRNAISYDTETIVMPANVSLVKAGAFRLASNLKQVFWPAPASALNTLLEIQGSASYEQSDWSISFTAPSTGNYTITKWIGDVIHASGPFYLDGIIAENIYLVADTNYIITCPGSPRDYGEGGILQCSFAAVCIEPGNTYLTNAHHYYIGDSSNAWEYINDIPTVTVEKLSEALLSDGRRIDCFTYTDVSSRSTSISGLTEDIMNLPDTVYIIELNIPDTANGGKQVTTIAQDAARIFQRLRVKKASITGNLTLRSSMFDSNTYLETLEIREGCKEIPHRCFYGCFNLQDVSLPNSLSSIEDFAFTANDKLRKLILPENVTMIGEQAFFACSKLESISFNDKLISIGEDCFRKCVNLTSINITDNVSHLGDYCFAGCTNLSSIMLGASVTRVPYGFCQVSSLTPLPLLGLHKSIQAFSSGWRWSSSLSDLYEPESNDYESSVTNIIFTGSEAEFKDLARRPAATSIVYNVDERSIK